MRWLLAHRRLRGAAAAAVLLACATLVLTTLRSHVSLASDLAVYLLIVVVTSIVGGFYAALGAALLGSLLLNYYFTPPLHTFAISGGQNILALVIFLVVAVLVSRVVHRARTVAPLAESDRARTALLNAVSHDLRTPIASAKAAVSGLRAQDVAWSDADRDELLASADASLDRLTDLVTNLLDLSRLEAGALPVSAAPVGLGDVVSRALDHLAPPPSAVEVQVPDELPAVLADAGLLERVVANLVQNGLRFTPAGAPVTVRGSAVDGRVELRVIDSGPGFTSGPRFAPFQRQDDSPVPGEGVGLGLAIVRGFTEAMGGTVAAEQTPGGGATLVVRLTAVRE